MQELIFSKISWDYPYLYSTTLLFTNYIYPYLFLNFMRILNPDEFKMEKDSIIESIVDGDVFIYPTDTIYGIGCDAANSDSVKKIRKLKSRATNPFSVIAPSMDWIRENCIVTNEGEEWLKKLPGPYTLIFMLKTKECIAKEVNPGLDTLGVRIPKHWLSKFFSETAIPIVTTSVNKSSEDYMTSIDDLDENMKSGLDFVLYEGEKEGKPSKIIDLTGKVKIIVR